MGHIVQRRRRWRAVCASVAILYGAICAPGPAAADDAALPEVLTLEEAADFLRVDRLVLKDMARRQEVPGRRIGVAGDGQRTRN